MDFVFIVHNIRVWWVSGCKIIMQHIKRRSVTCACILLHDSFIFPIAFTPSSPTGSVADWFGCWFVGSSRGGPAAGLGFDSQPPLRLFPGVLRVLGGLAAYSGVRGEPFCFALLSVLRFLSSDFSPPILLTVSPSYLVRQRYSRAGFFHHPSGDRCYP